MDRPYTVASLAERWECSTHAVYALIREKRFQDGLCGGGPYKHFLCCELRCVAFVRDSGTGVQSKGRERVSCWRL